MSNRSRIPIALGLLTLLSLGPLLAWDVAPRPFPIGAHAMLAAVPLALVALALLVYQGVRRASVRLSFAATWCVVR